jgi:hypothetical protein
LCRAAHIDLELMAYGANDVFGLHYHQGPLDESNGNAVLSFILKKAKHDLVLWSFSPKQEVTRAILITKEWSKQVRARSENVRVTAYDWMFGRAFDPRLSINHPVWLYFAARETMVAAYDREFRPAYDTLQLFTIYSKDPEKHEFEQRDPHWNNVRSEPPGAFDPIMLQKEVGKAMFQNYVASRKLEMWKSAAAILLEGDSIR